MNKLLKIFCMIGIVSVAMPTYADDTVTPDVASDVVSESPRVLTERTNCAVVNAEINTLKSTEDPDAEMLERLAELQVIYRRDCNKNTARRRALGRGGKMATVVAAANATDQDTVPVTDVAPESTETTAETVIASDDTITPDVATTETVATTTPDAPAAPDDANVESDVAPATDTGPTAEEIAALIDAGLCIDGEKPNKYGCCAGEKFTDLGDGLFGCCPADVNLDCFPPITTGEN